MRHYNRQPKRILVAMTWDDSDQMLGIMRYAHRVGWSVRKAGPLDARLVADWVPEGIVSKLHHGNPDLVRAVRDAAAHRGAE